MAIEFKKHKKRQKYLIGIAGIIMVITVIILWRGFFYDSKTKDSSESINATTTQAKFSVESLPQINFDILEVGFLKDLASYPIIEEIDQEEVGREDPFLPYQ